MKKIFSSFPRVALASGLLLALSLGGCAGEKVKNQAKESAARYWQDKAYPGKSYDVQVTEAEKTDDGTYRVKGIVDGETRVGVFNPDTESFSEGYYSLAHERSKRIAELEEESKYWKEKAEALDRENYKLKVQLGAVRGGSTTEASAASGTIAPGAAAAAAAAVGLSPAGGPAPASVPAQ